jgi:hypothetical protein
MSLNDTVRARPISFAEVAALAHKDAEPLEVYRAKVTRQHGRTLTPVTLTPEPVTGTVGTGVDCPHHVMFRAVPDTGPSAMQPYTVDRSQPVGYQVDCTVVSLFDAKSRVTLYTSEEAERSAELARRVTDPDRGRKLIYVFDPLAEEMPLTPVFGSQLTIGVVVQGLRPDEVLKRAEAALLAEFGDAFGSVRRVTSRHAENIRVNVYADKDKAELVATGVLAAEAGFVAAGKPYVEEVDPAGAQIA